MFFAINSTTKEKVNSITIHENASYNLIEEDIWFADPDEINFCPKDIDIKKIKVRLRLGHRTINFNGTEYVVSPHFFIPNKTNLGIDTIPESREHKLAKNWIYNKIINNELQIAYSTISKPYKYNNIINLFDLPIDKEMIGIETTASTQKNRTYRRADIICPFICSHPILGNGIVFEIQFSKQREATKISRELDWAIRGYSICWIFKDDMEILSDTIFKTKENELKIDSFASLIKQNNKSFGRDLKILVREQCRKLDEKKYNIINEIKNAKEIKLEFNIDEIKDIVDERFKEIKGMIQPICPKCKTVMLVRTNKSSGEKFWGCVNFCRGCTMPHEEY